MISETSPQSCCAHGIGHQHRYSQWTDASRHRRIGSGDFKGFGMHIAYNGRAALGEDLSTPSVAGEEALKFCQIGNAIDANVDHRGARLDHLRRDEARTANGSYENVGLPGDRT